MVLMGTGLLARRERCGHTGLGFSCSGAVSGQAFPRCRGLAWGRPWCVREEAGQAQTWAGPLSAEGGFGWEQRWL